MNLKLIEAKELFRNYKLDEAQIVIESLIVIEPNNIEALLFLGKIHSRTQNYGMALNVFNSVLEKDSKNSEALTGLELIKSILKLTNNYYYENPYTDDDLYDF